MVGQVIVVFRVMPDDMENFEDIKKEVSIFKPKKMEEEPIAFGMKAVKATFLVPELEGELDKLEENLRSISHVADLEVLEMSRSL